MMLFKENTPAVFHNLSRLVLGLTILFAVACKDDNNNKPQNSNVCQGNIQLYSFPLSIGNEWNYKTNIIKTDSLGTIVFQDSIIHHLVIEKDTIIDFFTCYKLNQTDTLSDGSTQHASIYYANKNDGLFLIATESLCYFLVRPIKSVFTSLQYSNLPATSFKTDSLWFPDSAECVLKFPANVGDSWTYWDTDNGLSSQRSFINYTTTTTPAGIFDCIRLKSVLVNNGIPNSEYFLMDYSCKGLTRQQFTSTQIDTSGNTYSYDATSILFSINF